MTRKLLIYPGLAVLSLLVTREARGEWSGQQTDLQVKMGLGANCSGAAASCTTEIVLNGVGDGKKPCQPGWGAAIQMYPRSDGSLLARIPGMESPGNVDQPGTVVVTPKD